MSIIIIVVFIAIGLIACIASVCLPAALFASFWFGFLIVVLGGTWYRIRKDTESLDPDF